MSELSPTTRALLRAAKADGPGSAARATIWRGVTAKVGTGAAAGAAGASAGIGAAKLLVMGALLGSTITVGLAAFAIRIAAPRLHADTTDAVHADSEMAAIAPPTHAGDQLSAGTTVPVEPAAPSVRPHAHPRTVVGGAADSLDRETALVAEARGALVRGEPGVALNTILAARALPSRALEPEELSLEGHALRALGRTDEAKAVEEELRMHFPENALAR